MKKVRSECQSVEQAVVMQGMGVVQEEGVANGAQVPDAGDIAAVLNRARHSTETEAGQRGA